MKKTVFLFFIALTSISFAQGIKLDETFGESGVLAYKGLWDISKVAALSDGKILFLGDYVDDKGIYRPILFKVDNNGKLDSTFSEDGIQLDTIKNDQNPPYTYMNIQADGKIFIANIFHSPHIICFEPNGNLYLSFGKAGVLKLDSVDNILSAYFVGYSPCPDNKLITCWNGDFTLNGSRIYSSILVKYDSTGCIDKSFGSDGYVVFEYPNMKFHSSVVKVLPDGSIIWAGSVYLESFNEGTTVFKLYSDGTVNPDFGVNGKVIVDADFVDDLNAFGLTYEEKAGNVIELEDHRILVISISDRTNRSHLIRLLSDGSLDNTFGNNGISEGFTPTYDGKRVLDLTAQKDGRIFIDHADHFCFNSNGTVDSTIQVDLQSNQEISGIALQDNNIILSYTTYSSGVMTDSIVRLLIDEAPSDIENTFANNDITIYPLPFKDVIHFKSDNAVILGIILYDLNGLTLLSKTIKSSTCDLSTNLPKGVFLCKIVTTKGVEYHKLMSTGGFI